MNKDLLDQIPADEQPMAKRLMSAADEMKISPNFQRTLETQLMDARKTKSQPAQGWHIKIFSLAGWAALILAGAFLLNWSIRSLAVNQPASENTPVSASTFEEQVRQGSICANPLTLGHGFAVFMSNADKTSFIELDPQRAIGELRSFSWSADGAQLAVVGNTTGTGNMYLTDSIETPLRPIFANSEFGYLMDAAWSRDGKRLSTWTIRNNMVAYIVNADGTKTEEINLGMYTSGAPQFSPDGQSLIFEGSDSDSRGLFALDLSDSQIRTISNLLEDETGFAWSPDGSRLAYFEMDRLLGEARLVVQEFESGAKATLASLPIPKGSGSSIPNAANLSWSQDGTKLVFEFGRSASDRAIYLTYADGSGLVQLVSSAHAPAISSDGNCLAYISGKQAFLLDLTDSTAAPVLIADLPSGRSTSDFRMDKLQWQP